MTDKEKEQITKDCEEYERSQADSYQEAEMDDDAVVDSKKRVERKGAAAEEKTEEPGVEPIL